MTKTPSAVLFARAEEAFLHAAITGDERILADARELQREAEAKSAKETTRPKRDKLEHTFLKQDAAAGDPVAAALIGDLTFDDLRLRYELGDVERFLTQVEQHFMIGRTATALRYVLLARHVKQSLQTLGASEPARTPSTQASYVLAARGHLSDRDRAVVSHLIGNGPSNA